MKLPRVVRTTLQHANAKTKRIAAQAFDEALHKHDPLLQRHCMRSRLQSPHPTVMLMAHALTFEALTLECSNASIVVQPSNEDVFSTLRSELIMNPIKREQDVLQRMRWEQPIMFNVLGEWIAISHHPVAAAIGVTEVFRIFELLPDAPQPV